MNRLAGYRERVKSRRDHGHSLHFAPNRRHLYSVTLLDAQLFAQLREYDVTIAPVKLSPPFLKVTPALWGESHTDCQCELPGNAFGSPMARAC